MEALCSAMESLTASDPERHLQLIVDTLQADDADKEACCHKLIEGGALGKFAQLLDDSSVNHCLVAQVIAEIAKIEMCRVPCVEAGLVPALLTLMDSKQLASITQACRALGNICFDNDAGRAAVASRDGVQRLLDTLRHLLECTDDAATVETSRTRTVACGFLLNLCNTHASLQEVAVEAGALQLLRDYLCKCSNDDNVCQFALLSVGCLTDSEWGKEKLLDVPIAVTVANLLNSEVGNELQDSIFELLNSLAEDDAVKAQLADSEVLRERLLAITASPTTDDDSAQLVRMAADLLVLLLTGDASMEVLYAAGKGRVYVESLSWLRSSNPHLTLSGALAVGNFARNDVQCVQLADSGVLADLLALLRLPEPEPTLLHAALSALRNLAIPEANKSRLLSSGLLDAVLPHISVDLPPVQFKLLGTLRLVLHQQESACVRLGTDSAFMNRLAEWCGEEEHAGVKGEATRLVAALVKHSSSSGVCKLVVSTACCHHLINMLNSEHSVMQNEALVALNIIAAAVLGDVPTALVKDELIPVINVQLTESDIPAEVTCNTLSLVVALSKSDEIKSLLKLAHFSKLLKDLTKSSDSKVKAQAKIAYSAVANGC